MYIYVHTRTVSWHIHDAAASIYVHTYTYIHMYMARGKGFFRFGKFSKLSSLSISYRKLRSELTFENFCLTGTHQEPLFGSPATLGCSPPVCVI